MVPYRWILVVVFFSFWQNGLLYAVSAPYDDYVKEIKSAFIEQMEKDLNLQGYSAYDEKHEMIEALGIEFRAHQRATIQEARALELLLIEQFVKAINSHEKIQPHLAERPFTHRRVSVAIYFESPDGGFYADGSVVHIFHGSDFSSSENRNHLVYQAKDPLIEAPIFFHKESYEKAIQLNAASPIMNPAVHQRTEKEEAIDGTLDQFMHTMSEEYGLSFLAVGGKMATDIKDIAIKIIAFQPANREDARQLLVEVTEKLLVAINNNEKLRPHLADYPFSVDRLRILICFRTKSHNSYSDGISMEDVKLQKGKITYYHSTYFTEEGEQKVFPVTKIIGIETYPEAKWIVETSPQSKKNYRTPSPSFFDTLFYLFRAIFFIP